MQEKFYKVISLPESTLYGINHKGIDNIEKTYDKLIEYALLNNLSLNTKIKIGRLFFDSFKTHQPSDIKMFIFLFSKTTLNLNSKIDQTIIKKGKYLTANFNISINQFESAWQKMFKWMHQNGYIKKPTFPFEIYHNDYRIHPNKKCNVDFYIPII